MLNILTVVCINLSEHSELNSDSNLDKIIKEKQFYMVIEKPLHAIDAVRYILSKQVYYLESE